MEWVSYGGGVGHVTATVFGGSFACDALEYAAEVVKIQYAAMLGDGLHLQVGGFEQILGHVNAAVVDVGGEGLPRLFFEQTGEDPVMYVLDILFYVFFLGAVWIIFTILWWEHPNFPPKTAASPP